MNKSLDLFKFLNVTYSTNISPSIHFKYFRLLRIVCAFLPNPRELGSAMTKKPASADCPLLLQEQTKHNYLRHILPTPAGTRANKTMRMRMTYLSERERGKRKRQNDWGQREKTAMETFALGKKKETGNDSPFFSPFLLWAPSVCRSDAKKREKDPRFLLGRYELRMVNVLGVQLVVHVLLGFVVEGPFERASV